MQCPTSSMLYNLRESERGLQEDVPPVGIDLRRKVSTLVSPVFRDPSGNLNLRCCSMVRMLLDVYDPERTPQNAVIGIYFAEEGLQAG